MLFPIDPGNVPASRLAAVAFLMAAWWVSDAIPLFATALLPLILFPFLGIMSGREAAPIYFNSTIVLFIGGFMIALTMEKWKLHRRIALAIIHAVGGGPARIVLGFMLAAAFLSMWISNTATAVMMVPIGLAIVLQVEERFGRAAAHPFTVSLMLGIAYSCSIGGLVTLVGTPPNLSFVRIFEILFPEAPHIAFGQWIVMGLPLGATMLLLAWFVLTHLVYRAPEELTVDRAVVLHERSALGPISFEEKWVLAVFTATAALWVFRVDLELGIATIPGWSRLIPFPQLIDDGTVAIMMASILFFIPARSGRGRGSTGSGGGEMEDGFESGDGTGSTGSGGEEREDAIESGDAGGGRIMGPEVIPRLPWDIVLLFGGGFVLAAGFQQTGLAQIIGDQFAAVGDLPPFVMMLLVCLMITFLTELTSNTATTEMILPILAAIAVATQTHPLALMIPATISASCAFMMPVATPPNAIIFGSGRLTVGEMARAGMVLNLTGALVVAVFVYTIGSVVFQIDPTILPDWAEALATGTTPP